MTPISIHSGWGPSFSYQDFPFCFFRIYNPSFLFNIFLKFLKNPFGQQHWLAIKKSFKANTFIEAAEVIQQFMILCILYRHSELVRLLYTRYR